MHEIQPRDLMWKLLGLGRGVDRLCVQHARVNFCTDAAGTPSTDQYAASQEHCGPNVLGLEYPPARILRDGHGLIAANRWRAHIISGCVLMDVMKAAHIIRTEESKNNDPENGLLLRADLHVLFDLNLIGIDPTPLQVSLHPGGRIAPKSEYNYRDPKKLFRV